ncbi:MAG: peptidoglycan-associated lipoprotein Pal [Sphingomonadales bacterium]
MQSTSNGMKAIVVTAMTVFLGACATTDVIDETPVVPEETTSGPEMAPTPPVEVEVNKGPEIGSQEHLSITAGDRVFFAYNSTELNATSRRTLQKQADWLSENPYAKIKIEGHCDERGTREYNLALGDRRATAAKNYLVALGVSTSRISTVSYGKERPVVLGSGERSWSQNRRAASTVS